MTVPAGARIRQPLLVWSATTAVAVLTAAALVAIKGRHGAAELLRVGPLSDLNVTLLAVALTWSLGGLLALLLARGRLHRGNALEAIGFFAVAFLYLNVLRERGVYGDVQDYFLAARNLARGEPLHARYLYPPFWATVLRPFVFLGEKLVFDLCWLLNVLSLGAFYFLLRLALRRYALNGATATLATFLFMVANVPILRSLGYTQVNLHVVNLIFIFLLAYPRARALSALALALAAHFKVSPVLLAGLILLARDWRWLAWFVVWLAAIGAATVAVSGVGPYHDFLHNLASVYQANGLTFRDNSVDSWVRGSVLLLAAGDGLVAPLVLVGKALIAALAITAAVRAVQARTFTGEGAPSTEALLLNALPPTLVLMQMMSPLVWEHHAVFAALPYLVTAAALTSVGQWSIFGLAYLLEYLLPTFDFFPFSYGRLISPLLLLGLMIAASADRTGPRALVAINRWTAGHLPSA
ncbi:MAG TPA: glycosyltransferase family 87 protein [Polyangia bacterium]|nr:glycosyltransferase family 87 protein [Polyangia bacterium]